LRNFFSLRLVRELSLFPLVHSGVLFLLGLIMPGQLQASGAQRDALLVQGQAEDLAGQAGEAWAGSSTSLSSLELMLSSNARHLGARLAVFSQQGALLAGSRSDGSPDPAAASGPDVAAAGRGQPAFVARSDPDHGNLWLYLAVPFHASDGSQGVLRYGVSLAGVERDVKELQ
jgi:hypothetical protein